MSEPHDHRHFDSIDTMWPSVRQAHGGEASLASAAQAQLLDRYGPAARRYLLAVLHDSHAADDVYQEFTVRFLRGDFRHADPTRGRFRDLLKTAIFRLVLDYKARRSRQPSTLENADELVSRESPPESLFQQKFLQTWRSELVQRTWAALQRWEPRAYTLLNMRSESPAMTIAQLAETLTIVPGNVRKSEWVRKQLHVARQRFMDLFLQEVAKTLSNPSSELLEDELRDLGVLEGCRPALKRWRESIWN